MKNHLRTIVADDRVLRAHTADPGPGLHQGSCDLELWPMSGVEHELAVSVATQPWRWEELRAVCGSVVRARAVLHRVDVERAAEAVIARIGGAG